MELEFFFQALSESLVFDYGFQYMIHNGLQDESTISNNKQKFRCFCPCGDNFSQWRRSNDLSTIFASDKGINTNHVCQKHEEFMSPSTYIRHLMEESATSSSPFHQLLLDYIKLMYRQHECFQYISWDLRTQFPFPSHVPHDYYYNSYMSDNCVRTSHEMYNEHSE